MRIMLLERTRGILGVLSIPLLFPLPLLAAVYVTRWVLGGRRGARKPPVG
ncbi:hypothetical protein HMPREF9240_01797 [Winkia neuii BV029A5]|uniref:Uncharacterized protein n=1 Tax=Winkia neuii BV029A5 TaxID=888439 RepID=K0ZCV9_9ACTO|nr:hypothetical protein HMPREF9240_01797 [Winkia neuii BV029A5]